MFPRLVRDQGCRPTRNVSGPDGESTRRTRQRPRKRHAGRRPRAAHWPLRLPLADTAYSRVPTHSRRSTLTQYTVHNVSSHQSQFTHILYY